MIGAAAFALVGLIGWLGLRGGRGPVAAAPVRPAAAEPARTAGSEKAPEPEKAGAVG